MLGGVTRPGSRTESNFGLDSGHGHLPALPVTVGGWDLRHQTLELASHIQSPVPVRRSVAQSHADYLAATAEPAPERAPTPEQRPPTPGDWAPRYGSGGAAGSEVGPAAANSAAAASPPAAAAACAASSASGSGGGGGVGGGVGGAPPPPNGEPYWPSPKPGHPTRRHIPAKRAGQQTRFSVTRTEAGEQAGRNHAPPGHWIFLQLGQALELVIAIAIIIVRIEGPVSVCAELRVKSVGCPGAAKKTMRAGILEGRKPVEVTGVGNLEERLHWSLFSMLGLVRSVHLVLNKDGVPPGDGGVRRHVLLRGVGRTRKEARCQALGWSSDMVNESHNFHSKWQV